MQRVLITTLFSIGLLAGCNEDDAKPIDKAAAERGGVLAEGCRACHSVNTRENRVGPSLLGVVGRQVASVEGYEYSEALKSQEFTWKPERIVQFILDPIGNIPGTKMAYGGITTEEASDIVEFLRSQR